MYAHRNGPAYLCPRSVDADGSAANLVRLFRPTDHRDASDDHAAVAPHHERTLATRQTNLFGRLEVHLSLIELHRAGLVGGELHMDLGIRLVPQPLRDDPDDDRVGRSIHDDQHCPPEQCFRRGGRGGESENRAGVTRLLVAGPHAPGNAVRGDVLHDGRRDLLVRLQRRRDVYEGLRHGQLPVWRASLCRDDTITPTPRRWPRNTSWAPSRQYSWSQPPPAVRDVPRAAPGCWLERSSELSACGCSSKADPSFPGAGSAWILHSTQ